MTRSLSTDPVKYATPPFLERQSVMRRPLFLRREHASVRLCRIDPGGQSDDLRPQSLDLLVLTKDDVAQFCVGALQEGDLGLYLLERMVIHRKTY